MKSNDNGKIKLKKKLSRIETGKPSIIESEKQPRFSWVLTPVLVWTFFEGFRPPKNENPS